MESTRYRVALVDEFERRVRSSYPVAELIATQGIDALHASWDDGETLAFVDFLLAYQPDDDLPEIATGPGLEHALLVGGSAWKVGIREGFRGLERRVPEGVQAAADRAIATPGNAGLRLSDAWHAIYGLSPNPGHAYKMAVAAVEDATIPAVVPKQAGATLGHVIGQLKKDGDWSPPLTHEDRSAPTAQTVLLMCQGLWAGHHDRHGGIPDAPVSVSQEEAETAVHMAVFLVQGFASGLIKRRR